MKATEADKLVSDMSDAILACYHFYRDYYPDYYTPQEIEKATHGFYTLRSETSGWGVEYHCLKIPVSEIREIFEDCVNLIKEYSEKAFLDGKKQIEEARITINAVAEKEEEIHNSWFGSEEDIKNCIIYQLQSAIKTATIVIGRWKQTEIDPNSFDWESLIREALTSPRVDLNEFHVHSRPNKK